MSEVLWTFDQLKNAFKVFCGIATAIFEKSFEKIWFQSFKIMDNIWAISFLPP